MKYSGKYFTHIHIHIHIYIYTPIIYKYIYIYTPINVFFTVNILHIKILFYYYNHAWVKLKSNTSFPGYGFKFKWTLINKI